MDDREAGIREILLRAKDLEQEAPVTLSEARLILI
jgi:hypothetical protein